jgi:REP element-mobilizing transposase RayT
MSQSLSQILLHVIFSTKHRQSDIVEPQQAPLYAYLAGTCRAVGSEAYRIGGTADHVHIACTLPRTLAVSKLVEEIKKSSSMWIKQQTGICNSFAWQNGYGVFSLGQSQLPAVLRYIDQQEKHHRVKTFQEEFREFLVKYKIQFDERYVWD